MWPTVTRGRRFTIVPLLDSRTRSTQKPWLYGAWYRLTTTVGWLVLEVAHRKRSNVTMDGTDKRVAARFLESDPVPSSESLMMRDRIWENLVASIGADPLSLWIDGPEALTCVDGQWEVSARDSFTAERIRRGMVPQIRLLLKELASVSTAVTVTVARSEKTTDQRTLFDNRNAQSKSEQQLGLMQQGAAVGNSQAPVVTRNSQAATLPMASVSAKANPSSGKGGLAKVPASLASFVEGDTNGLAIRAARSVVERPGLASPLLFCGPTGTGKTHLLEGIVSGCRKRKLRTLMLTSDQFTSLFIEALQGQGLPSFRRKYRDVDVFVLDDIQFLPGKRATLVELQHTISEIERAGGQVVFASDRPLAELDGLGPDLVSRIQAGMVCSLAPVDVATRKTILVAQTRERHISLEPDVIDALASALPGDGRLIRGALNRIELLAGRDSRPITWGILREALGDLLSFERAPVHLEDISRIVADFFGVPLESLRSGSKLRSVSGARMLAMWLARQHTRSGLTEIGRHFGSRSHSTVISARQRVEELRQTNDLVPGVRNKVSIADAIVRLESRLKVSG
jgi:chromosomal replication initiator protein